MVRSALGSAEDRTARFYCIPEREWPRFPYEVRTRAFDPGPPPGAFADLVRVRVEGASDFPERFRIRLDDDRILAAVRERREVPGLYPLLLYLLTHELVHVIRFGEGRARWDATDDERRAEERRVHGITRRILEPLHDGAVGRVADRFARHLDEIEAGWSSPK